MEEKKGKDIVLLDIHELTDFTEYFILCSGTSVRMLQALADDVTRYVRDQYHLRGRMEGLPQDGWILVDYGDVILHLFSPERRGYYRLEDLWGKGRVLLNLQ